MRRLLILAALVAGCGAPPAAKEEAKAEEPAPVAVETATVDTRDVRETLAVDGTFTLPEGTSSRLAPTVAGRLVQVGVKEGDRVTRGQLLARIDTRTLEAAGQSAAAGAAAASATAAQADLALRAARADQTSAVAAARLALGVARSEGQASVEAAQADLKRVVAPPRAPELAQAQQVIEQARIARDKARLDADRDRRLLAEGLVAGSQADASAAALRTAESGVRSAEAALALLRIGPRPEEVRAARERLASAQNLAAQRVAQARAALAQAQSGALNVAAKAQEAAAARLAAAGKAADARGATASVATGEIRSPLDGVVVRRFLNPGDVADPTTPVLAVARVAPTVDFVGTVSPAEASRVQQGMAVLFDGFTGRVASVGEADPASGLVPLRVHCAGEARSGAFATGRVVLSTLRGVPTVPKGALLSREDKDVVFAVRDGVAHMTTVAVGPEEGDQVAIRKGLQKGARVVVLGGHELSDGAKVEAAEKG